MLIHFSRRGFTLLETMLATCLMGIVGGAVYQLLVTTQRLSRIQTERVGLQANLRAGSLLVTNELREASAADLLSRGASNLVFRAMRGLGFLCQPGTTTQLRMLRSGFSGHRDPQPGRDSVYAFLEGAVETARDDTWLSLPIAQVSATASCPSGAGPGIGLTVPSTPVLADLPAGTPIRVYEIMELKLYRSEGKSWLGARSVSAGEAIQPLLGPLADGSGFRLDYLDGSDRPTVVGAEVNSVRVSLRGTTEAVAGATGGVARRVEEEMISQVALRNAALP